MDEIEDLAALRLQMEWGVDEALLVDPVNRFAQPARQASPALSPPKVAAAPFPALPVAAPPSSAAAAAAAAHDLASLHAAMTAFEGCALRHTASSTVAPSGNPAAALLLISDIPSPDDDRSGQSMSGALGERVDRVLASAGFARQQMMFAPMVPWRPPGGRPASDAEIAVCLPFLHRLLTLVRPARLVLLGAGPFKTLAATGSTFRRARGTWDTVQLPDCPPLPALVTLAPELWLSTPANKLAIWTDLLTLRGALS